MAETGPGRPLGYLTRIPHHPLLWCWGQCGWGRATVPWPEARAVEAPRGIHPFVETEAEIPCAPRGAHYRVRASGKMSSPMEVSEKVGTTDARSFLECGCWEGGTRSCGSHVVTMRGISSGMMERPGCSLSAPGFRADPASGPLAGRRGDRAASAVV